MSQAHLTGFMNKCCLLPGGNLLTVRVLCLFCLSLRLLSPSFFLPTVHLQKQTVLFLTYPVCLSHTNLKPLCLFCVSPKYSNVRILMPPNAMNGRGLFCFCFSPTHLSTLTLSLPSLRGLVRQLCSVGRVSESDLTSAVLLLS